MSLAVLAQDMASKGRNGDSMLVHMTPGEVAGLHALALKHGGTLTINPETGLPEANFLKKLLPTIAGFALNYFVPGLGNAVGLGLSNAATAGVLVGGVTGLATGSLSKGLMAGLGAYGGFGLGEAITGAGANALTNAGAANYADTLAAQGFEPGTAAYGEQASKLALEAQKEALAKPFMEKATAGLSAVTSSPEALGSFAKSNIGNISAAAAPIMADMMVPTATKVTPVDTGNIRKFSFDPYSQRYTPQGIFPAAGYKGGMADGGIVALANGGAPANPAPGSEQYVTNIKNWFESNPNATAADVQSAMQQYGLNQQDVQNAMKQAGLSGAAQFAAFNTDIGSAANTAETYGGIKGLSNNINYWLEQHPGASANDIANEMKKWDLSDQDFMRATGKSVADYTTGPITEVVQPAEGLGGNTSAVVNPNGTVTQVAMPTSVTGGQPIDTVQQVKDIYTQGGGSTGYVVNAPKTMAEFNQRFNTLTPGGDSEAAYNYLMGKGAYPTRSNVGEIMKPYSEAVLGVPQDITTKKYLYDARTRKMVLNPDYVPMTFDTKGVQSYGLSQADIGKYLKANNTATDAQVYAWALANNVSPDQIAAALGVDPAVIRAKYDAAKSVAGKEADAKKAADSLNSENVFNMADGGATGYAMGGLGNLGGYSDGGRLLKGPGDGVSDSIPATIGQKRQPARLADGEFVIPARIVSELGNGSTDAGAKKLYAMMDRVQRARGKTTGKNKVAANSRADKYLPA